MHLLAAAVVMPAVLRGHPLAAAVVLRLAVAASGQPVPATAVTATW